MKNNRWIYCLSLVSIIFTTSSCFFYKTVSVEDISATTIEANAKQKQFITLQEEGSSNTFLLENYILENGVITGNIKKMTEPDHPGEKNLFSIYNRKIAKSYLHLYTTSALETGPIEIPVSNISGMKKHENEYVISIIATTGVIAVAAIVAVVVFVAIACSCPHVATINPDGSSEFQGSLFPGSIFKSLKRKDFLVLNNVQADKNDLVTVQVFNDLDEVQYIDKVELLSVQHSHSHIGLIKNAELMAYNVGELPTRAMTQIDRSVIDYVTGRDDVSYDFDDPAIDRELNSVELSFNTADLKKDALLVIRGQQTELLEHTAEVFFQQFGTKFPSWVEEMNDKEPTNYNQNSIDQGIALNVYVLKKDKWNYIGSFENVGAMAQRDLAIPIDLSDPKGEIKIKLESAYGFWSLDQITLTSDWSGTLDIKPLALISAVNQDGKNVMQSLENTDDNYLVQSMKGTSTNLKFKALNSSSSTYVLSGSGYYNHERSYTNGPNYKFLKKMKRKKHSTHNLAQVVQLYKDMHLASNN